YGGRNVSIRQITSSPEDSDEPVFCRQMLHAHRLIVKHPIKETLLSLEAPVAADMQRLIDLLEERTPASRRR
ncbi:MAG TPA: RluA family pseudouridine synthase, partial [Phycisphaerae bacterium]|nr:RluA family pseudouridine synthase [Phycisphaerae bacterium]